MAGEYGFVYLLGNDYMPNLYKIGCTERSPHQRALEVSNHTGVPAVYDVICFIEVEQMYSVERMFHKVMENTRINPAREFFKTKNFPFLHGLFRWYGYHHAGLSYTDVAVSQFLFLTGHEASGIVDPYVKPKEEPAEQEIDPDDHPFGRDAEEEPALLTGNEVPFA